MGRFSLGLSVAAATVLLLFGGQARAQDMCNPPCPETETCTREGQCIPSFHSVVTTAGTSVPSEQVVQATPVVQTYTVQPVLVDAAPPLDPAEGQRLYLKAKRQRTVGGPLLVVGIAGMAIGMAMMLAGELDGGEELYSAGMAFGLLLGAATFIPGLVLTSKGNKGMRRYRQYASTSRTPMPRHLVVAPTGFSVTF